MKKLFFLIPLLLMGSLLCAQESSPVSPAFYGPNAFPVPEIELEWSASDLSFETGPQLASLKGFSLQDDVTLDGYFKLRFPLFSNRVALTIWGEAYDWFRSSAEANAFRGVEGPSQGGRVGEISISTDILLLHQEEHYLNLLLRSVLKSAAGEYSQTHRYYDSPGYFFDMVLGRRFELRSGVDLIFAASSGFLCWQTGAHAQNDAAMYGFLAGLRLGRVHLGVHYGGYVGWKDNGDCPMSIRAEARYALKNIDFVFKYHEGLIDWPYRQFSLGLSYHFHAK